MAFVAAMMLATVLPACNSDDNNSLEINNSSYSNTSVKSFSLAANSKVLYNLDSVFFSIDLTNAQIFNAQPLPYQTDIQSLIVNITTDNCSVVELSFQTKEGSDTTIDYLKSSTDSINFSAGPVVLHVVSYDSQASRDYLITVNVYQENPDSVAWTEQSASLPQGFDNATETKTVLAGNTYYMLASNGSDFSLSTTSTIYDFGSWSAPASVVFGFAPVVESLTGTPDGMLYILGTNNVLYTSSDKGTTWTSTGTTMDYIFGPYKNSVLGAVTTDGKVTTVQYPGDTNATQPSDFPAKGTSQLLSFDTSWQINPLAVMSGGETADGTYSGDTWGFDGNVWAKISASTLPAMKGASIFKYTLAEADSTSWRIIQKPVIVGVGGLLADGTVNPTVYYSNDMGAHWREAPDYMQLTDEMPQLWGQQALVQDRTLYPASRAIAPIEEWQCPFIFLFGGNNAAGNLNTSVWQGVLVRYTMVPLE